MKIALTIFGIVILLAVGIGGLGLSLCGGIIIKGGGILGLGDPRGLWLVVIGLVIVGVCGFAMFKLVQWARREEEGQQ